MIACDDCAWPIPCNAAGRCNREPFTREQEERIREIVREESAKAPPLMLISLDPRAEEMDAAAVARQTLDGVRCQAAPWAAWPALPDGGVWSASPISTDGVALTLTPDALIRLCVDRVGRLSATGRPLYLQLPASLRGGHAA